MWEIVEQYWRGLIEIVVLSVVVYYILRFIWGTRGARVLIGFVSLLLFLTVISQTFELRVIGWLLGHFLAFLVVALVVIFQPELRRALAELGGQPVFLFMSNERAVVDILSKTLLLFSARRIGALIAVEREIELRTIVEEGGAVLEARLSQELLEQIFFPNSPLHDGGVIIQNDRLIAAACIFPLTQRTDLAKSVGTRHRAAMGLSEDTDAVVLVVSEETGRVSVACGGELHQNLDPERLHSLLIRLLIGTPEDTWWGRLRAFFRKSVVRSIFPTRATGDR
jgi:diadenylate cyclase